MIKKLRFRFIVVAMLSVGIVLGLIIGTINVMNYRRVMQDVDMTLGILAENALAENAPEENIHIGEGQYQKAPDIFTPPGDIRRKRNGELLDTAEYFYAAFNRLGNVVDIKTGEHITEEEENLIECAVLARDEEKEKGIVDGYRYVRIETNGIVWMFFLDIGRVLAGLRLSQTLSISVSLVGLAAVFFLVVILSKRVVRPFAESYEKQRRFITDAGHEIKTPLTIIDADAAVLGMEFGENEWLSDIEKQTARLKELTEDLIYLSRMEEGQRDLKMVEFPLSETADEMAESFELLAKARGKTFSARIEPMVSYCGNMKDIKKLFSVLLDNAVKYSPEGGSILFELKRKGKAIVITVWNTAQGMEKEKVRRIFDRFYRMDQSRNSQTGGYGIGLSVAKAIVEAHKGKISADTEDGKSLTIAVTLRDGTDFTKNS